MATPSTKPNMVSMTSAVIDLKGDDKHKRYNALVRIRKQFLKEPDGYKRLRLRQGIEPLVNLVKTADDRQLNVILSILGNCCTVEECKQQVLHYGILENLDLILEREHLSYDLKNRACRIIGNIATTKEGCESVHQQDELVVKVTNILNVVLEKDEQLELKQVYCRTVRLLGDNKSHIDLLIEERVIKFVAECLKTDDNVTVMAAFKALVIYTKPLTSEVARQLLLGDTHTSVLRLLGFTQDTEIKNTISSLSSAVQLAAERFYQYLLRDSDMRAGFGSAGLITYLTTHISKSIKYAPLTPQPPPVPSLLLHNVNALALCCQDAVNRSRMRNENSLGLLILVLQDKSLARLHNRTISGLVCFLYDFTGFTVLINKGLVEILLHHLRRVVSDLDRLYMSSDSTCAVSSLCCGNTFGSSGKKDTSKVDTDCIADNMEVMEESQEGQEKPSGSAGKVELCEDSRPQTSDNKEKNLNTDVKKELKLNCTLSVLPKIRIEGEPTKHEPTKHEPTKHEPTKHEPTKHEPTKHEPTKHEPTKHEPTKHEPTKHEPTKHEPTKHEPTKHEPTKHEPTSPELFDSPVQSPCSGTDSQSSEDIPLSKDELQTICSSLIVEDQDALSGISEGEGSERAENVICKNVHKTRKSKKHPISLSGKRVFKPSPLVLDIDNDAKSDDDNTNVQKSQDELKCEETLIESQSICLDNEDTDFEDVNISVISNRSDNDSPALSTSQSYSIHSPTYIAMQNDNSGAKKEDYFFGPKNLRDSNLLYSNSPLSQPYRSPFTQPFSSPSSSGGSYSPMSVTSYVSPSSSPVYQFSPPASPVHSRQSSGQYSPPLSQQSSVGSVASYCVPGCQSVDSYNHIQLLTDDAELGGFNSDDELNFGGSTASGMSEALTSGSIVLSPDRGGSSAFGSELGMLDDPLALELMDRPLSASQFPSTPSSTHSSPVALMRGSPGSAGSATPCTSSQDERSRKPLRPHSQSSSPRASCSSTPMSRKRSYPESLNERDKRKKCKMSDERRLSVDIGEIIRTSDCQRKAGQEDWNATLNRNRDMLLSRDPRRVTEHSILLLLARVSYMSDNQGEGQGHADTQRGQGQHTDFKLLTTTCVDMLWNYCVFSKQFFPRAQRLLLRLCRNAGNLEEIINRYIPVLLGCKAKCVTLNHSKELSITGEELTTALLSSLTLVAESSYGQGLITHLLLTASPTILTACSIAVPFIIKDCTLLNRFLFDCDVFQHLLNATCHSEGEMSNYAHHALAQIIKALAITERLPINSSKFGEWPMSDADDSDLTFELEDGICIKSKRSMLISKSQVFSAMLDGHFVERNQSMVKLSACSAKAFTLLNNYYANEDECKAQIDKIDNNCSSEDYDLDLLLECLALGDRFVAIKFQLLAAEKIAHTFITIENIVQIVGVASMHGCDWLIEQCLLFLLDRSVELGMSHVVRQQLWQEFHSNSSLLNVIDKSLRSMIQKAL